MSTQSVQDLLGEDFTDDYLGGDRFEGGLIAGWQPDRSVVHIPQMQLGDGLAGPPNDQALQIFRDDRPLAVDELGMQGPFTWHAVARHRAGRMFPLNYEYGAGLEHYESLPGRPPEQDAKRLSPFSPGQLPAWHDGVPAAELTPTAHTVYFTATPQVGWGGY